MIGDRTENVGFDSRPEDNLAVSPVKAVNHIGIAVRSIDDHRPFYESVLGAVYEGIEEIADQGVRVAFFRVGDVRLELLEPTDG